MFRDPSTMRRSHAGYSYEPVPAQYDAGNSIEEENERMTVELADKVNALKTCSIDIGTEIRYQNRTLLQDMDNDMERTGGFLGNTMNRVLRLSKGSHNYYILYIFLFSIVIFFILWLTIKFR